jgi:hypothetical protein
VFAGTMYASAQYANTYVYYTSAACPSVAVDASHHSLGCMHRRYTCFFSRKKNREDQASSQNYVLYSDIRTAAKPSRFVDFFIFLRGKGMGFVYFCRTQRHSPAFFSATYVASFWFSRACLRDFIGKKEGMACKVNAGSNHTPTGGQMRGPYHLICSCHG